MRRLLVGCLVAAAAPFAPSSADVSLSIVGPGASKDDPALGTVVQLNVSCGAAACPPWVRVDRLDGVADSTPFMRLVDEGYTFTWAPTFPHFFEPGWGIHSFPFGGSSDGKPISIVASGLSAKYNGTALTKNSSALTIYYSMAFEGSKSSMAIEDLGPGSVRLTLKNTAAPTFDTVRFDRYFPSNLTASPPQFAVDFFFNQHSGTGSIMRTFQEPGVYYWGVTPTFKGRAGGATAGGVFGSCGGQEHAKTPTDCQPTTHPVALVVKGPNGEDGNQTVPPGFAGTVHHLNPLQTKHQFCIFERNLTVFNGVQVRVPLCRPGKSEQPPQPGFISVVAPSWMKVQPLNNLTCATCRNAAKGPALNSSAVLPGGMTRYTFAALGNSQKPFDPKKPNARYVDGYLPAHWATYNNYAPLYVSFAPSHEGKVAELSVMIHRTPDSAVVPLSHWQTLSLRCIETPKLKKAPKRLVTSITWASIGEDLFMDTPEGEANSFWLDTYRGLGFNTVPHVSMPGAFTRFNKDNTTVAPEPYAPPYTFPTGRTSKAWQGLSYGPQVSTPNPSMGVSTVCKPPNATLLPSGLSEAQIQVELTKWDNAFLFHNSTKHLDVAYDGIFSQRYSLMFCKIMEATQPDWVYIDDEAWGEGWNTWKFEAALSANAKARAMPGEKPIDLAWRMAAETMTDFTGCLATVAPKTNVHWYGYGPECPFPDGIFADAGISMGPSEYGQPHYLTSFADSLRLTKLQQVPMRGPGGGKPRPGEPRHLLPWLTACTYGQMDAVQAWEEALHSFGSGATGFAYFGVFFHGCFDGR